MADDERHGKKRLCLLNLIILFASIISCEAWDYRKQGDDWPGLCQKTYQSPVDIVFNESAGLDSLELELHYPVVSAWQENLQVFHTGAAIQVKSHGKELGYIYWAERKYYVRELNFHGPAEHTLRGQHFPLELQIVHQKLGSTGDDDLVIISALYRLVNESERESSKFLDKALYFDRLPNREGMYTMLTDPFQLGMAVHGLHNGYFQYVGSTTTPPCTVGVVWIVLETLQEVTVAQMLRFNRIFKGNHDFALGNGNNRELQPLGQRKIHYHNHKAVGDGDGTVLMECPQPVPESEEGVHRSAIPHPSSLAPEDLPPATSTVNGQSEGDMTPATLPKLYMYGGDDWTRLCASGYYQSPIDIKPCLGSPHGDYEMRVEYDEANISTITNVGWSFEVKGAMGTLIVRDSEGDNKYVATALYFHSPAEHTIDGRRAAFELEIVHEGLTPSGSSDGSHMPAQIAILSVLFHESTTRRSDFLQSLSWRTLPSVSHGEVPLEHTVNLNQLRGLQDGYYSYVGSLSRPPCRQGVKRFVLRTINDISTWQLTRFQEVFRGNSRRVQPAHGRGVLVQNVNSHKDALPKYRNSPIILV